MHWIHKEFQLNEHSFSSEKELIEFSKTISSSLFHFLSDWFSKKNELTVKTSGSTGTPKNIQLKKQYMQNSAFATGTFFELKEKTRALCCLPINFIAGKMMIVRALILGWYLEVIEPNSKPLKGVEKKYDFAAMTPLQLSNSLKELHLINKLIVGGGIVSADLQKSIQKVSTEIYATYGMTETITHIAVKPLNLNSTGIEKSCYKLLPNISISRNNKNCLVIDAPKISDSKVITNDVVEIISETEFEWKGRYDNVINSGGIKLHPEEIEKKLSEVIDRRFFVAGIPDGKLGEKIVLIIEGKKDDGFSNSVKNLKTLSKFEIPKEILFAPKFSETKTGKIQRNSIKFLENNYSKTIL